VGPESFCLMLYEEVLARRVHFHFHAFDAHGSASQRPAGEG